MSNSVAVPGEPVILETRAYIGEYGSFQFRVCLGNRYSVVIETLDADGNPYSNELKEELEGQVLRILEKQINEFKTVFAYRQIQSSLDAYFYKVAAVNRFVNYLGCTQAPANEYDTMMSRCKHG